MIGRVVKGIVWVVVGIVSVAFVAGNVQTPWQYSVDSTIAPGTEVTLTPPTGEIVTMKVAEGQAVSGQKTFDIGAPLTLLGMYVVGSAFVYGLKSRNRLITA